MDRVQIYRDKAGQFRWRRKAPNGEIISSGESHRYKHDAFRSAKRANLDYDWTFTSTEDRE